jgi:hypothetical protein
VPELWALAAFIGAGVGITLVGNLVVPLVTARLRLGSRASWAREHGFRSDSGLAPEVRDLVVGIVSRGTSEPGEALDVLSRGDVTLVDWTCVRGTSGPTFGTYKREGVTLAIAAAPHPLPRLTVAPRGRIPIAQLRPAVVARVPRRDAARVEALLRGIETGDAPFDAAFRLEAERADLAATLITAGLRARMLRCPDATYAFAGRHVVVHRRKILAAGELLGLVETATGIRDEVSGSRPGDPR